MAYINRENLIQVLAHENSNTEIGRQYYGAIYQKVMNFPTADVVEVKHGRWIYETKYYSCSICAGKRFNLLLGTDAEFCPYCGAKMDAKKDGV